MEDQWCPHTVQVALAADGNGTPAAWTTLIVVRDAGESEEWLAHPPKIMLRQWNVEEEFTFSARCRLVTRMVHRDLF